MAKNILLHILACLLVCSGNGISEEFQQNILTYYGDTSYAMYPTWQIKNRGVIRFLFKTNYADGVLLYVDDQSTFGNYLKLSILNSKLVIEIQVTVFDQRGRVTIMKPTTINSFVSDNYWHHVTIQGDTQGRSTKFRLDDREVVVDFEEKYKLQFSSNVFLGGIHTTGQAAKFVDPRVAGRDTKSFIGCIKNVRYGRYGAAVKSIKPLSRGNTDKGCRNKCYEPTLTCFNGGRCSNRYRETGCDCHGTGYYGKTCQKPLSSLHMNGGNYIAWTPRYGDVSSQAVDIFLGFKSMVGSGILLLIEDSSNEVASEQSTKEGGYLFLEVHWHSLYLHFKTRGLPEQNIKLGRISGKRTAWRYIKISKRQRDLGIKLNDGNTTREYIRQMQADGDLSLNGYLNVSKIYVGGISPRVHISLDEMSRSQRNFTGCIQDVFVNQYDLVQLKLKNDRTIRQGGSIQDGCPEFNDQMEGSGKSIPFEKDSMETHDSNNTVIGRALLPTATYTNSKESKRQGGYMGTTLVIAVSCGGSFVLLVFSIAVMRCYYRRKIDKEKKHCELFIRQQHAARNNNQTAIPLSQKCMREEMDTNCDLHTFSPVRRDFYVSEFDTILRSQDTATAESTLVRSREHIVNSSSAESVPFVHDTVVNYDTVNQKVESLFKNPDKIRCQKISPHNSNNSSPYGRNSSNKNHRNNNQGNNTDKNNSQSNNNNIKNKNHVNNTEQRYALPCQQQQHHRSNNKRP